MPTPTAIFRKGDPLMVDHTPGVDVPAGAVVVTAATPRVCHRPIPANTLGALAQSGGVYDFPKSTAGGSAIPDNTLVYWDATAQQIATGTNSGANKRLGYTVGASLDGDATQRVAHLPG